MSRRSLGLVIAAFVVTRLVTAWLAVDGETYGAVTGDTVLYEAWADRMVEQGQVPYSDFSIEYPPGSLPLIALPKAIPNEALSYRTGFVWLMVLVDAAGLVGLLLLARRWGSELGPWLWVALIPLLGPITYLRLDLAPAVATVWAIERGSVRRWGWTGALLMFAAIAKIYALLLLPAALWVASDRRRFLLGAAAMALPLLLLGPALDDSVRTLVEYHGERGIQIESLWGSFLLIAIRRGVDAYIVGSFGALHLFGDLTGPIKLAGLLASVAALCAGTWLAARFVPRGDARQLAGAAFVILALVLAVGTVLSPQFLMWIFAPAAAALCAP
ncbi:MAG: glycosyltransferase 87 family protein, partial [Actinomycetota bacterium]